MTLDSTNVERAAPAEEAATSLLGATTGELVLRMNNGPQAGRVVRLSAAKCTIGSSPDCTLRLRGAGIEPVHCMIVRGARQTVVRRWSNDTRVNDRHFDDVGLRDGDRLAVGPVEFQVLKAPGCEVPPVRTARRIEAELAAATDRIEQITQRLDLANRQGRRRLRSVLGRLRKYQLRLNDIEGRRSQLAQEQERLQAETVRLAEQNAELEARKSEWQRERDAWQRQTRDATDLSATLAAEQARLKQAEQALRDREADLIGRVTALEDRLAHLAAGERKLAARETELARQADDVRKKAADLESKESEVARRLSELQTREAAVQAGAGDIHHKAADLVAKEADAARRLNEIQTREAAVEAGAGDVRRKAADLEAREIETARRTSDLFNREVAVAKIAEAARRTEAEVAARCEALKNHWAELIERERNVEQDRERLAAREQALNAAHEAAAAVATPTVVSEPTSVVVPVVDVEAAAEARRRLDDERLALNVEREELAAESAEIARTRLELSEQEAELSQRRATLELAARVLDRRAALAEADEVAAAGAWQTLETAKAEQPAEPVAQESLLEDRLRIEHLEALVKTWRNEAELWKSRFDEVEFGDVSEMDGKEAPEREPDIPPREDLPPQPETDVHAAEPVAEAAVDAEVAVEEPAETVATEEVDEVEPAPVAATVEPPKEVKAESAAEVLRRLGMSAVLDDEAPAAVAPPPPPAPRPTPQPKAPEHHEGDESLDDYMQQLFQRLGVKQQSPAAPAVAPQTTNVDKSDAVAEAPTPVEPVVQQAPLTASEFKARSVAAERKSDLTALRELANNSAKAAIAKHQVKTQSSKSKWKLLTAAGSLGISAVSAVGYLVLGQDVAKYGIVGGVLLAAYALFQSAGFKHGAAKSARSLDDVLQKSAGRAPTKDAAE